MTVQTLFALAGVTVTPARLPAPLVLIDCQTDYFRGGRLPLPEIERPLGVLVRLLQAARAAGAPVIHVAHRGAAGKLLDRAGPGGAIVAELAPVPGEIVVEKTLANSFAGTDLARHLAGHAAFLLAGFMTHNCVASTARAARDLGFLPTIVADACGTRDLPDGAGGIIAAAEVQRVELAALADRHAVIARAADVLA